MSIVVEIPDSVAEGLRIPSGEAPSRIRCELAAALYQQEILAYGKAAELAGLTRENFAVELARRIFLVIIPRKTLLWMRRMPVISKDKRN
jgi:predicted HTH domain antitoxin